ncbi:MAG: ornithine cyclodeaminase family protein [Gammaproteobacteria bacterium]|nr:ornithine cyclodeaminase family protein [Gammaproteobacteria bacterium]
MLQFLPAEELSSRLPWPDLVEALDQIFVEKVVEPVRHHHFIDVPGQPQATLLLMPAWIEGQYLGVKQVAVFPGNSSLGLPGLNGSYLLSCARTGQPLLQIEANELTARRTAAASALASRYLSRPDSRQLLLIGAGRLARALVAAHRSVRPIDQIQVWSRTERSSKQLVKELVSQGLSARVCGSSELPEIAAKADIISCATMATEPLIRGDWLQSGVHLDLVGAFRPDMRETDDQAVQKSAVFVDTRAGALAEAGDLTQAMDSGAFSPDEVVSELAELCGGKHAGRQQLQNSSEAITLFKSVGAAREDLAAAMLAYKALSQ